MVNYRLKLLKVIKIYLTFYIVLLEKISLKARLVVYKANTYSKDKEDYKVDRI